MVWLLLAALCLLLGLIALFVGWLAPQGSPPYVHSVATLLILLSVACILIYLWLGRTGATGYTPALSW